MKYKLALILFLGPIFAKAQMLSPQPVTLVGTSGATTIGTVNQGSAASVAQAWFSQQVLGGSVVSASNPFPISQTPSSNSSNAITPVTSSVANETCHVLKAAPGNLYLVAVYNSASSGTDYLELFNSTTAPSNGSIVQGEAAGNMIATPIPVNALTFVSQATVGNIPTAFSDGITVCLSSTNGLTFTGTATGNFTGLVQ